MSWSETFPKIHTITTPLINEIAVMAQIGASVRNGQQSKSKIGVNTRLTRSTTVITTPELSS